MFASYRMYPVSDSPGSPLGGGGVRVFRLLAATVPRLPALEFGPAGRCPAGHGASALATWLGLVRS
jgi:hypothetical protein